MIKYVSTPKQMKTCFSKTSVEMISADLMEAPVLSVLSFGFWNFAGFNKLCGLNQ